MAILRVHVVPNAKAGSVAGEYGGAVKIKLRAPAVEGKANTALIRFLVEQLELPRHAIVLERGQKSRDKLIRINGLSEEEVRGRFRFRYDEIFAAVPFGESVTNTRRTPKVLAPIFSKCRLRFAVTFGSAALAHYIHIASRPVFLA